MAAIKRQDVIKGCNLLISSNKGISLDEEYLLMDSLQIFPTRHTGLNHVELVSLAIQEIYRILGRKNVTPRDLKKAVIKIIRV